VFPCLFSLSMDLNKPEKLTFRVDHFLGATPVVSKEIVFERDKNFSLQSYAERSFGVFQEEHQYDVVWKFSPRVTADAMEFIFHPTQSFEETEDGSLIVRFKASGRKEMDWHLYTWGEDVEDLTEYYT
ncbi:helix-turn-helix transcriptional regulator, partial [Terasakiella pusilla]|uniref:helix-turn-helix transcriptional regulator n=1 Tax=Terasakiella pusilla TaxID=64973 RepID=UPI00056DE250